LGLERYGWSCRCSRGGEEKTSSCRHVRIVNCVA
jgi:hypothetical protein